MTAPDVLGPGGAATALGRPFAPDVEPDPHDAHRVRAAPDLLRAFNQAGLLAPADVHVAATVGRLVGESDPAVLLATALAVRAPRLGHVCVDLATAPTTAAMDEDVSADPAALPWPEGGAWLQAVMASPLVAGPAAAGDARPLRLVGCRLYLDRYWRYEQQVIEQLRARSATPAGGVDAAVLRAGLDRLFPRGAAGERPNRQRLAAATAVLRRFAVIAGGPGTGKTTTVAGLLALLAEQALAAGRRLPRAALAAPTGKAADRLEEAVRTTAADLPTSDRIRARLATLDATTLHRLLGRHPAGSTRFRHHRGNPLPFDLVVVDETSMVSLALMAKLLDAVRRDARLVLVGDPEQLASVEAGAVLGDLVGPAAAELRMAPAARRTLEEAAGEPVLAREPRRDCTVGDGIIVLTRVHRFAGESGIAALALAVQRGDADAALAVLEDGPPDVVWIAEQAADPERVGAELAPVRSACVAAGARVFEAARDGDGERALAALAELRLICAHRRGPFGVASWVPRIERWLTEEVAGFDPAGPWYVGRPMLVTENDYELGVYNGDVGVVVAQPEGWVAVAFDAGAGPGYERMTQPVAGGRVRLLPPTRLEAVETVYAMTVHKSQGSQFHEVVVILPDPASPVLTRELLYTAITRARRRVMVVGSPEAVRTAVDRRIHRASGLREALWGE